ncbi:MAG: 3-hydroxyacyl-CoA dehydrogenase NAD-binding domain-containing protein [Candidatus Acidiferrum sp.]
MTKRHFERWFRDDAGARMEVKTIALIGAGVAGRGMAYLAALSGYRTILEDVSEARLGNAVAWVTQRLESAVGGDTVEGNAGKAASANLSTAHTVEDAIRDADLIIETLPDEMEMQIELFTILDKFAKPNAIFASTGFLSITELAEVTFCADRCIGIRFAGSPAESITMQLVRGLETSNETIVACSVVAGRLGKEVAVVNEPDVNKSGEPKRKLANA